MQRGAESGAPPGAGLFMPFGQLPGQDGFADPDAMRESRIPARNRHAEPDGFRNMRPTILPDTRLHRRFAPTFLAFRGCLRSPPRCARSDAGYAAREAALRVRSPGTERCDKGPCQFADLPVAGMGQGHRQAVFPIAIPRPDHLRLRDADLDGQGRQDDQGGAVRFPRDDPCALCASLRAYTGARCAGSAHPIGITSDGVGALRHQDSVLNRSDLACGAACRRQRPPKRRRMPAVAPARVEVRMPRTDGVNCGFIPIGRGPKGEPRLPLQTAIEAARLSIAPMMDGGDWVEFSVGCQASFAVNVHFSIA